MIYGLVGKKRSGKDECASIFIKHGFKQYAFADPIKEISKIIFSFTDDQLFGESKEDVDDTWKIKPRDTFQFIGTDAMRNTLSARFPHIGKNIWIKHLQLRLERTTDDVIVSDIRYQNELDMIKQLGGKIYKVQRTGMELHDSHESESGIDDLHGIDAIIENDKSLDDLHMKVEYILR